MIKIMLLMFAISLGKGRDLERKNTWQQPQVLSSYFSDTRL